jgi:hypothetical protein
MEQSRRREVHAKNEDHIESKVAVVKDRRVKIINRRRSMPRGNRGLALTEVQSGSAVSNYGLERYGWPDCDVSRP